jgi:hypothetical protein
MNAWELLEIRESLLRDLAEFIQDDYYGTLPSYDHRSHELDFRLGRKLKFSSSYPKMTVRQRRASNLLLQLGLCGGTSYALGTTEDEDQLNHWRDSLTKMESDLANLLRDYEECLSEAERKLLIRPADPAPAVEGELKDSERKSLLKMVLGMAIKRYGYNPSDKKNSAVSMIVRDLELMDIRLTDDTVRNYLKEAAYKIPFEPLKS